MQLTFKTKENVARSYIKRDIITRIRKVDEKTMNRDGEKS